ncbi:hypothetical protein GGU11DRAFT_751919 [Lentinula aff. detonsa]|nr:hypothetical protein GGU11DRAFT_751919 [Lentinula aff. detonsa]
MCRGQLGRQLVSVRPLLDDLHFSYSEDEDLDHDESPHLGASHPLLKCETKIEPSNLSCSPNCFGEDLAKSEVKQLSEILVKSQEPPQPDPLS